MREPLPAAAAGRTPFAAVNSPWLRFPGGGEFMGGDLLWGWLLGWLVSELVELFAVEVGEVGAVASVGDEQVKDGPYE